MPQVLVATVGAEVPRGKPQESILWQNESTRIVRESDSDGFAVAYHVDHRMLPYQPLQRVATFPAAWWAYDFAEKVLGCKTNR